MTRRKWNRKKQTTRLLFMQLVQSRRRFYWRTTNGFIEATEIEAQLHQTLEAAVKELQTLRQFVDPLLTEEQRAQLLSQMRDAPKLWVHVNELTDAVKAEREACAEVALNAAGRGWDPKLPHHIAHEILARPVEPPRRLATCSRCGYLPRLSERPCMLDPADLTWKCGKCYPSPASGARINPRTDL